MRVLYILHETTMFSGANKSFLNLCNYIQNTDVEPIVVCPDNNGIASFLNSQGITVISTPYTYNIRPKTDSLHNLFLFLPRLIKRKLLNRIAIKKIANNLRHIKPQIIHSNTSVINIGFGIAQKLNIPHITHIREYGDKDHRMYIYGLKKRFSNSLSYAISITHDILNYRGLSNNPRAKVIYNGIISSESIRYNSKKSPFFLYAGRIDKTKGISDLIDAYIEYSKISTNILDLKIAGDYSKESQKTLKDKLQEKINISGIKNKVQWLGECNDINDLMYQTTATIIPSYFEGFGRVMPEAIANGSLVIARNTGGSQEQFDNGLKQTGDEIGLRFNTVIELANILKRVSENDFKSFEITIDKAQQTVRQLYTNEISGKQILDFYNLIING